ncbi:MAG: DnaD domain protein [Clostridia bacterium]|nr:DnaD domain protein [Clostridia bacterium]
MKYQFEETRMQSVAVPTRVVDGLLGIATGAQLKVLLFLMRFDKLAHDTADIAKFCNIPVSDVESAIDFWVKERIFVKEQGKLRLVSGTKTIQPKELPRVQPTIILEETSKDFRDMIAEIQRLTGKPMNALMVSLFYNMAENLHFSPEMIVQLTAYCNSIGKFSYRYMETVAAAWYDDGIDTFEKAEEKIRLLEESRAMENRLARAFGVRTAFSSKQKELIAAWSAMGLSEELIMEAYNRCMDRKGQMSFAYMNKILEDWGNKGYKKLVDIEEQTAVHTGMQQHQGLSELERIAIERLQAGGKG